MNILVACEESGVLTAALCNRGFNAYSCDVAPTRGDSARHIQQDVLSLLTDFWDAVVAFPPCTHLCVSGARWFKDKLSQQISGIWFFMQFVEWWKCYPSRKLAIENPVGIMSTYYRKPDQIVQPWQFGHGETKATCLWLHNLPLLQPTDIVAERESRIHKMGPSPTRARDRSETYKGIADAMASQWF